MFLDRNPTLRIVINTVIIILALAIVIGSIILIAHMLDVGSPDDGADTSGTDTADTQGDTHEKDTEGDTEKPDSDSGPEGTEKPDGTEETESTPDDTTTAPPGIGETVYDVPKTMYALYNVNARMSATTESDIYGLYYQGDAVTVTGETENGWYRVNWRGYTAYIRNDLLTEDAPAASVTVTDYDPAVIMYAQANVNVRTGHTTSSEKITMIDIGTEVTVTGKTSNGWYRVDYNGGVAYISEKYLAKDKPEIPALTGEADSE